MHVKISWRVVSRRIWEEIEFYVDSGATETAVGEDMLNSVETRDGVARRKGVLYEVANGVRIPNLGEKCLSATRMKELRGASQHRSVKSTSRC